VWIVDPVDGTREYGEARTDWAVHVGLAVDGAPVLGAGAARRRGDTALRPADPLPRTGAAAHGRQPHAPRARGDRRSRTARRGPGADGFGRSEGHGRDPGQADIYLHSGGQYEWDSCAPVAVALAHGLHASRIDGSPLVYNQRDTYMPDLLICRKEHAQQVLDLVRDVRVEA
jgi:3'(2'), 5'-bisphosphate nucleotidase